MKLLLNSGLSGPHAWFALAQTRGYFKDAGLEVEFVAGDGAAVVVPRIGTDGIEAGYGDMNALIKRIAGEPAGALPEDAPIGVYAVFNTTPLTIAVAADGPVRTAWDLPGRTVSGHGQDAALKVFPAYALAAGIDPAGVAIHPCPDGLGQQVRDLLLTGEVGGVFGFVNTIIAAATPLGIDSRQLRFLEFADHTPDLYGNTLMVTRRLARDKPQAVQALVAAINRGLADTAADIDAGMAALAQLAPSMNLPVQRRRLIGTLAQEMANPEGALIGIGAVDEARLARGIALIAKGCGLPRLPAVDEVFTAAFLPPLEQRVRSLAR